MTATFTLHVDPDRYDGSPWAVDLLVRASSTVTGPLGVVFDSHEQSFSPGDDGTIAAVLPALGTGMSPTSWDYHVRLGAGPDAVVVVVPAQAADTSVNLSTFTSTTPGSAPLGFDAQLNLIRDEIADLDLSGGGSSGPAAWGDVTGKPATFPPSGGPYVKTVNGSVPDGSGNVTVASGGGGGGSSTVQDTGLRKMGLAITALDSRLANPDSAIVVQRVGNLVSWNFNNVGFNNVPAGTLFFTIPAGFVPRDGCIEDLKLTDNGGTTKRTWFAPGDFYAWAGHIHFDALWGYYSGSITYMTNDPFPSTLPGNPY